MATSATIGLAITSSGTALRSLATTVTKCGALGALTSKTGLAFTSYAVIHTGGRINTAGPGSVGVLVRKWRRGGGITSLHGSIVVNEN